MEIIHTSKALKLKLGEIRAKNLQVGFVPTMGSLHAGHTSLLTIAKAHSDFVVLSIFVNPTQFNLQNDYLAYPTAIQSDLDLARTQGVDVVFVPEASDLYDGIPQAETVDYGNLTGAYEGANRKGHFDGVVAVVRKLFKVVSPDRAFFGEKDLQQLAVVRELAKREFRGLEINSGKLIRDENGLALSSRNIRLSETECKVALELSRALLRLKGALADASKGKQVLQEGRLLLKNNPGIDLEYFDVIDAKTFSPLKSQRFQEGHAIVAAQIGSVRLIDNLFLGE